MEQLNQQSANAGSSSDPFTPTSVACKSSGRTRRKLMKYIKYLYQQDRFWDRALKSSRDAFFQLAEAEQRNASRQHQPPEAVLRPSRQVAINHPLPLPQDTHLKLLKEGFNFLVFYLDKCEDILQSISEDAEARLRAFGIQIEST